MKDRKQKKTPSITSIQAQLVDNLDSKQLFQIDEAILQNVTHDWRKVAMVAGMAMIQNKGHLKGVPDVFYARRIEMLASDGKFEISGDAMEMRHSEVRLPTKT
ncbi:DUF3658 domain-containing protein [Paraburkholderia dipogonis]|uniref:DUF3658 domain-containing protein n=1 Tax=Paraburkholderia dipogonis TaxID=1211383 RepID=A0ABW9AXK1_9BURK